MVFVPKLWNVQNVYVFLLKSFSVFCQVMYLKEIAIILISLPPAHKGALFFMAGCLHTMHTRSSIMVSSLTADKELYREPLELMYTKYHVNHAARARNKVVQVFARVYIYIHIYVCICLFIHDLFHA